MKNQSQSTMWNCECLSTAAFSKTGYNRSFTEDVSQLFSYELSNYPSFMFDSNNIMQVPQKSNLADAPWFLGDCSIDDINFHRCPVCLRLHHIPWVKGLTFSRIAEMYAGHVCKKYYRSIIVFDKYDKRLITKDQTHHRRNKGILET